MKIIGKKWLSCWLYVMIAVTGIIIGIAEQVICVGNCVVATSCFGGMAFPRRLSHDVQPNGEIRLS